MKPNGQRPRILICGPIAKAGIEQVILMLEKHADVDAKSGLSQETLLNCIGNYEAIIVNRAAKIGADVIKRAERLRVIGQTGARLDNIDVVAAKERDIKVINCPGVNTRTIAEHTLALLLELAYRLPQAELSIKEGRWKREKLIGPGLTGKTVGIIGFGRVGRQVAIRARAFGMRVLVNQPRPTPELNLESHVEPVDLTELLKEADFVTLHVPANPETDRLISLDQLALMKPTAYLINTARKSVIDEAGLLEALNKGVISGAAMDVFTQEPNINIDLIRHKQVVVAPHIATSAKDNRIAAAITVAKQVIDIIKDADRPIENPLSLRVVPTDRVLPHENVDSRRVNKLAARLEADGILSNPPIVIETGDHYVVLDGATRTTALKQLNYPHTIVQIVSPENEVSLHTWFHAIRQIEPGKLIKILDDLPEISMLESSPSKILDEMFEYGGLCYLHTVENRVFLVQVAQEASHIQALNKLTEPYITASRVERTLNNSISGLRAEYPDLAALVVFQEHTVEQVLQIAQAGRVLPAGITRFVIPGRVLRLKANLDYLRSDKSLAEKNEWLRQLVVDKFSSREVRYYQEPVYLLDE